jgi:hypothetical protein
MQLPPGVADPLFICELALEMGMPVGELGERMSNHELTVIWPAYFQQRDAMRREAEEAEQARKGGRRL